MCVTQRHTHTNLRPVLDARLALSRLFTFVRLQRSGVEEALELPLALLYQTFFFFYLA